MSRTHFRSERHAALEVSYPACNGGPCRQGKALCPSPLACRLPEGGVMRVRPNFIAALVIALVLGATAFWGTR